MVGEVDWLQADQDKVQWRAVMNMVMKVWGL
jgi:hypothetical protein